MMHEHELQHSIERCRSEQELDTQIKILHEINENVPTSIRVTMPSLLTNDFVYRALDTIEERIMISRRLQAVP